MKELSIEQKAKRYDEAIKVANSKIKDDKDHVLYEEDITEIFPELAESEDEEIRKAAIAFVKASDHFGYHLGISKEKVIAWLENQGENHIVGNNEMVKSIDKVESKFKAGDWITIDKPCQIISINDNGNYIVQYCDDEKTHELLKNFCESHFHLWTIEDAKEGDVLEFGYHGRLVQK